MKAIGERVYAERNLTQQKCQEAQQKEDLAYRQYLGSRLNCVVCSSLQLSGLPD